MDLDALLNRLLGEQLSAFEEKAVLDRLAQANTSDDELYTLLLILGRTGDAKYRKIMESYLRYFRDPMVASVALRSLVRFMGLTNDYACLIKKYCRGVDWDPDNDLRLCAIQMSADYLKRSQDPEMLRILLKIFDSETYSHLKPAVFVSLAAGVGSSPAYENVFDVVIDQAIVEEARKRVKP